jgi:hypothetical protein
MSNHHFMQPWNVLNRLIKEWKEHGELIIAYDFDNTVYDYHKEGHNYHEVIQLLRECKEYGAYLIVFTAAEDERHDFVKNFLGINDIPWDAINKNKPGLPFKGRKIYYNVLLDDRAGLESAVWALKMALMYLKEERKEKIKASATKAMEQNHEALKRLGEE